MNRSTSVLVKRTVTKLAEGKNRNSFREPKLPIGNIDVASMWNLTDGHSTKSAENLVLTITKLSCLGLGASASIVQLVESLVWPFVARLSLRKVWFSDKEFGRFVGSMRKTAVVLQRVESEDNKEQSFLKFWLDTFLCQVFKDPQRPVRDSWNTFPLFKGWCRTFVARAIAKRDVSFIYSLQKGSKRAWPKLGEIKEKDALAKHKQRLSSHHGILPPDLKEMINFTSQEVFKGIETKKGTKFMPSGSACLQASRRDGGALSLVKRFCFPFKSVEASKIGKLPVLNATLNSWRQTSYKDVFEVAEERLTSVDYDTGKPYFPALDVEVVAIPEPGKFRIITKGDGYLYSALQPVQGLLLDAWKSTRYSTMRSEDPLIRIREIDRNVEQPYWCSVDYEAATDLLKRDASLAAFAAIDCISWEMAYVSLFAGRAKYPDGSIVRHIEGQLMGHPLSFPLLCVINLAVYRQALERWTDSDRKNRTRIMNQMWDNVIVNGDDMLFKCPESFYPIFLQTALDAGFKISAGKNYLSKDCCMINSQVFRRSGGQMKRFGYLNLKLVKGVSLKGGDSEATPTQIGKDLSEMVKLCPWAGCAVPAAFRRWKKDWFGPIYRPNWYLPVHLGGFGLDRTLAPPTLRITKSQREMAARFVSDPRMALYRRKGMNLPTIQLAGALANWRMVAGPYVPREEESTDLSDSWLERLAYAARANSGSKGVADSVFISKFRPQYRLKPMSIEGIDLYWDAQVFASRLPLCPPIGLIKVQDISLVIDNPFLRVDSHGNYVC